MKTTVGHIRITDEMYERLHPPPPPDPILVNTMPRPAVLEIAALIELNFGCGGSTFPGAAELYAAADKINAWHAAWMSAP